MSRRLGPLEFIDAATAPVENTEQREPDPADKAGMERLVHAFGAKQVGDGRRSDSIFRRLHSELANVARGNNGTSVVPAAQRTDGDARLPRSGSRFEMVRDWDPDTKAKP